MSSGGVQAQHERALAGMQYLQLITRTFSTLRFSGHDEIADTISALVGSFFDCRARAGLRVDAGGELLVAAAEGFGDADLLSESARELWSWVLAEKVPLAPSAAELAARWVDAPAIAGQGFACAAIELHDRSVGIIAVAGKRSRAAFNDEDLAFLACASGIASMAFAAAEAQAQEKQQRLLAEARAAQAADESHDKQVALDELDRKLKVIERQRREITELSAPILEVHGQILAVPIIGSFDARRSEELTQRLLSAVANRGTRFVIIDVTGVEAVDTATADRLLQLGRAIDLLGAGSLLTGVRPAVAQTLVALGLRLDELSTAPTFGAGLDACRRRLAEG